MATLLFYLGKPLGLRKHLSADGLDKIVKHSFHREQFKEMARLYRVVNKQKSF